MHYIISDVHANIQALTALLQYLAPTRRDTLVFLGDYIDKHEATRETLSELERLERQTSCVFLRGNHDFVWDRYLNHHEWHRRAFLLRYGSVNALRFASSDPRALIEEDQIDTIRDILAPYDRLLDKMQDYYLIDGYLMLHAGLFCEQMNQHPLVLQERNYFMRPADIPHEKKYLDSYCLVAGHTFLSNTPTVKRGYLNIDLGAGYDGFLAAFCPEEHRVIRSDGTVFPIDLSCGPCFTHTV